MNYYLKYIKYYTKYINLKKKFNQLGSGITTNEIILDIYNKLLLLTTLYKNIELLENQLTFERISDSVTFTILFPINYPLSEPEIFINNEKVSIFNWTHTTNIIDYFNTPNKKVLILCHNKIVLGTFEPLTLYNHWYGNNYIFRDLFLEYNLDGIPSFDTVDIAPGGTYQADAFSDEFINNNINKYDLIMVPDCGGMWYSLQEDKNYDKLIEICNKLIKMLKPQGIILFSKFIRPDDTPLINPFANALITSLNEDSFTITSKSVYNSITLIVQKNI